MASIPQKHCPKCGTDKPVTEFHQDKYTDSGYTSCCKACRNARRKALYYERHNAELERRRNAYLQNAEQYRQDAKDYRAKNRSEVQRKGREWYHTNKGRASVMHRDWAQRNRDKRRIAGRLYIAKKRGNGGEFTASEWKLLCEQYNNRCVCCGEKRPLAADHIIPVSKGGSSNIDNIQPLCGPCNSAKRDRTIDYRPNKALWKQERLF